MENRIFTMVVVAALAVVLGIGIVSWQAKNMYDAPLLQEIVQNQQQMKLGQIRLERKMGSPGQVKVLGASDATKIHALESRVIALEMQIKSISEVFKKLQGAGGPQRARPPQEDYNTVHQIPVDDSYVLGNKNAPVTIVEFVDFECPFCSRFHAPVKEVLKAYPNDVKVIIKNFPLSFHKQAMPAAKAALAAGLQGKYFEMADKLLDNQRTLSEEKFKEIAGELGLNVEKFLKDYKDNDAKFEDIVKKDMTLGQKIGVRGTPTFFLNGKKTTARDINTYKTEIDKILKK